MRVEKDQRAQTEIGIASPEAFGRKSPYIGTVQTLKEAGLVMIPPKLRKTLKNQKHPNWISKLKHPRFRLVMRALKGKNET